MGLIYIFLAGTSRHRQCLKRAISRGLDRFVSGPLGAFIVLISYYSQTFGANFDSDGRLQGQEDVQTVQCDTNANTCQITVPAPGFALVFLSDQSLSESDPSSTQTFPTTTYTKTKNTVKVDPSVLQTSNGHRGISDHLGSTSKGSTKGSGAFGVADMLPSIIMLMAMVSGVMVVGRALVR